MRFLPDIAFGTHGYPEKVARRLRAVNMTAWIGAPVAACFAVFQAIDDWDRLKFLAGINLLDAIVWACVPLLHRFGALAAPVTLAASVYASNFAITALLGTESGVHLYYIAAAALSVLFFGVERWIMSTQSWNA